MISLKSLKTEHGLEFSSKLIGQILVGWFSTLFIEVKAFQTP